MLVRADHDVPARIGEEIENDEIELSPTQYQAVSVSAGGVSNTKDTLFLLTVNGGNILVSPWSP